MVLLNEIDELVEDVGRLDRKSGWKAIVIEFLLDAQEQLLGHLFVRHLSNVLVL